MKTLISTLILALAIPLAARAQQAPTQGLITYDLALQLRKQVAKKNPAIASLVPEVIHTTMEVPFRNEVFAIVTKPGKSSKGAVQIQTGGGDEKQIVNLSNKSVRTESRINGRSYYTEETGAAAVSISYQSGTKQIAGYTCNKAIVTTADKKRYTVWYTTAIPRAYSPNGLEFSTVKGAVLEYENDEMTCTATSITTNGFTAAAFTPDPKAKKITPEQMQDLREDAQASPAGNSQSTQKVEIKL